MVAGTGLYSQPRTDDVESTDEFTKVEIAVFRENGEWASYNDVKPIFTIIGNGEYCEGNDDEK